MKFLIKLKEYIKDRFSSIDNENLTRSFLKSLPFWLAAFISGGVAVLYANLFSLAEKGTRLIYEWYSWSFFIITPLCFVLAWWLADKYSPFARGSGIPQVTAAINLTNSRSSKRVNSLLSIRVILVKVLSSLVMVFGGGVIGREGPTIQISASIFKKVNDFLPDWYPKISKRNMIVTGAAAGLAAAFNTPLGGIVFAIEELTKTHFNLFKSALLTGVIIAGLTALSFLGPYLYLGYPNLKGITVGIIIMIIPLALITGAAGSGMGKAILYLFKRKQALKTKSKKLLFLILSGLVIAALAIFLDERMFGSGKEIMITSLFTDNKELPWYMPILRLFGPVISFSTGASGGIFAPTLSAGASIGAVCANWFKMTSVETNLMILCGMTGCLTGVTRSPFTSSIIVLEMTDSHNVIFYIMLTAVLANLIASSVSKKSFYDYLKDHYIDEIIKSEEDTNGQSDEGAKAHKEL